MRWTTLWWSYFEKRSVDNVLGHLYCPEAGTDGST